MGDKIDTSAEEEAVKDEARQFMSSMLSTAPAPAVDGTKDGGVEIIKAWKKSYNDNSNKQTIDMEKFWEMYDPEATSLWTMTYDEADSNENLEETIAIVSNLMSHSGMNDGDVKDYCFGVVHTLESLEIEGLWFFGGPDPEPLFGANDETSWFSWNQLGPEATDLVKKAVASLLAPSDNTLTDKVIKDTKVFC